MAVFHRSRVNLYRLKPEVFPSMPFLFQVVVWLGGLHSLLEKIPPDWQLGAQSN
jgi:hypothetical protein